MPPIPMPTAPPVAFDRDKNEYVFLDEDPHAGEGGRGRHDVASYYYEDEDDRDEVMLQPPPPVARPENARALRDSLASSVYLDPGMGQRRPAWT